MDNEITNIYQLFRKFPWSNLLDINETDQSIKIVASQVYILKKENEFLKLEFYDLDETRGDPIKRDGYVSLLVHKDLDILKFINFWANDEKSTYGYNFLNKDFGVFKKIFNGISVVKISENYEKDLQKREKNLLIKKNKFFEIKKAVEDINYKANSTRSSLVTYLVNQSKFDFLNQRTQRTTSSLKGDFDFLIHRFNLTTKKEKGDYTRFLDSNDLNSLSSLFDGMIRKKVFDEEFLRKLDEYFIKEKLEDIVKKGKNIINLKSDNVKSQDAKDLIKDLFGKEIGQLETVWQKYFEQYLLYLFFSYKKIVPKVQLKDLDNLDKDYPDFIGVNHYDGIDIIEIKTHLKNVLVWDKSHKNFAFSSEMSKAIIQTINYMDALSDNKIKKTKDKKDLLSYLNIDENLYRPRGVIIISSKDKICKSQNKLTSDQKTRLNKDFTKLRNSIHNIQIFTFDEILSITERYVENINTAI
ncbi:MAG: hypothetical protein QG614_492 [Patescibacteria group bacterium]|nr:hypothetical protein [Patescibacteria group bacterium]